MYFDNAATSFPKPEAVYQTMDRFLRTAGANPGRGGHHIAVEADRTLARARAQLAKLLNAPRPESVVWAANCTDALNLALKGLLQPGDHVVTTGLEHNSVARPLRSLERRGVEVTRVPCPGGVFDLPAFLHAIRPETRLVAMVHASNVSGLVLPVREVGAACRKRGVRLLVDAAQTAGVLSLDVREIGADMVAMPGHKSLLGPPGTGALYIAEGVELAPLKEGGTGSVSEQEEQPDRLPDRYESGTQNTVGIAGLGAGVEWILDTGRETIRRREEALVTQLWEGLAETPGVTLHGPPPREGEERAAVVSLTLEGWEPTDAALVLDQQFDIQCRPGLHCAPWAHRSLGTFPNGTLRLSPGPFNTAEEVDAVVRAVRELCGAS
ncbi:MAG TPA: aminotransferase class V-fold PLP-dependent enzyme [Armatimonadota bacterium]|nr:aminotransferase class V-fold PLP-dependent enzyme [Armatimonadota bacterium]